MKIIRKVYEGEHIKWEASYLIVDGERKVIAKGSVAQLVYEIMLPTKVYEIEFDWEIEE